MITRIEIDGFKSLEGFQLDFKPGLNILVGPNGSGKTNIVSYFEFLAHLMNSDASEATSFVGGAGAVFRRVGQTYERKIQSRILGCVETTLADRQPHRTKKLTRKLPFHFYIYDFTLTFPESSDSIIFEKQRFRLKQSKDFVEPESASDKGPWLLDIDVSYQSNGTASAKVHAADEHLLDLPPFLSRDRQAHVKEETSREETLGHMLTENNVSLIPTICRYTRDLYRIASDLTGGQIYNVVPSKLKLPEDTAKTPGIARDGSGLAATLYALQRSKDPSEFGPWFYYHRHSNQYDSGALDRLRGYLNLVNSNVQDITVVNDPFENQLRVRFTIKSGDYQAILPMSLMSDGTLKWLAVITAAVTASSVFCIEEPENYLHPQMQAQVVVILREILFGEREKRFTLMTTHSETLLNHCQPEELIIVSMKNGRTVSKRCSNAGDISDEISRTGFGLGYYYVSNAIQNE